MTAGRGPPSANGRAPERASAGSGICGGRVIFASRRPASARARRSDSAARAVAASAVDASAMSRRRASSSAGTSAWYAAAGMMAGRGPCPGCQARAACPAGSTQPLGCGDDGPRELGSRPGSRDRSAPGSACGGTIARRAELAGAEAVADEGGAEPGPTAGTAGEGVGDSGGAGARAVAASAAARAARAVRLGRVSPRAAFAPLVAPSPERAALASGAAAALGPSPWPERSRADASSPPGGVRRAADDGRGWRGLRSFSSALAGAARSLAFGRGIAPLASGALELAAPPGRELPAPGRRVVGRVGAKG
jgi:hypothetical protein